MDIISLLALSKAKQSGGGGGGGDSHAVTYTTQSLTTNQKAQARENIGAVSSSDATNAIQTLVPIQPYVIEIAAGGTASNPVSEVVAALADNTKRVVLHCGGHCYEEYHYLGKVPGYPNVDSYLFYRFDLTQGFELEIAAQQIFVGPDAVSINEQTEIENSFVSNVNFELALSNKQDELIFDTTPSNNSIHPVTSSGIYTALQEKENAYNYESVAVSSGVATISLVPNTVYTCSDSISSLSLTMPSSYDSKDEFIVIFNTTNTSPTITIPSNIKLPTNYVFGGSTHYELDICNDYGAVGNWYIGSSR